jgi:hypothetical protein
MPNTFELIASSTVGSGGAANIDFTSIPSTYTDLVIKLSARSSDAAVVAGAYPEFNGDTTSGNYTVIRLLGFGSSGTGSDTNRNALLISAANNTASTFGNGEIYIPNYAGSTAKSFSTDSVQETNATEAYMSIAANRWSGTAAINRVNIKVAAGNFVQYTTAYLYGVKNA